MTRKEKRKKKKNAANRYVSDGETWEMKQNEVKKIETVVLSLVVPVPELAHANNRGLDYEALKAMTKLNSLLK